MLLQARMEEQSHAIHPLVGQVQLLPGAIRHRDVLSWIPQSCTRPKLWSVWVLLLGNRAKDERQSAQE